MSQLQTNSSQSALIYILSFGDGYFSEYFAAIHQTAICVNTARDKPHSSKKKTSGQRSDIGLKSNWFYECGVDHSFVTLKAKPHMYERKDRLDMLDKIARKNIWIKHWCWIIHQILLPGFHMNAHSNLCSRSKAPGSRTAGVHQKTGGEHGVRSDGAPRKIVLGNHINHLKQQTLSKSAHTQASKHWPHRPQRLFQTRTERNTGKLCKQLQDSEVIPV